MNKHHGDAKNSVHIYASGFEHVLTSTCMNLLFKGWLEAIFKIIRLFFIHNYDQENQLESWKSQRILS